MPRLIQMSALYASVVCRNINCKYYIWGLGWIANIYSGNCVVNRRYYQHALRSNPPSMTLPQQNHNTANYNNVSFRDTVDIILLIRMVDLTYLECRELWDGQMLNEQNPEYAPRDWPSHQPRYMCEAGLNTAVYNLRDLLYALCDVFFQSSCGLFFFCLFFYHWKKEHLAKQIPNGETCALWRPSYLREQSLISQKVSSNASWSYCFTPMIFHFMIWWISIKLFIPLIHSVYA